MSQSKPSGGGDTVSCGTVSPPAPASLREGGETFSRDTSKALRWGRHLTRSTRLDFQSIGRSANCLNMPLRLTMMMAAKMA